MDKAKEILEGVKGGWENLSKKKKITLISLVGLTLLAIIIFALFSRRVNYVTLFSDLEPSDAGIITEDLEAKKIKYKLEDQGRKILIDEKHVDKYRLQLAMEGKMPENSPGFEIFDDTGLMVTDEDRRIMYQRALTGELEKSIKSLEAIKDAKVHLVMSEKSIFDTEATDAQASVILEFNPGYRASPDMIKGITALVAGAVENLPEENIQIIDSQGRVLSELLNEENLSTMDMIQQYQAMKEKFESKMESELMDLLGGIFGRDKVKVKVFADLDFDGEESSVVRYTDPVVRSEQLEVRGENINTQEVTGGVVGDNTSNVIESVSGDGSSYNRIVNHELTTETVSTIKAPGKINRMTTSVVYDGNLSDARIEQIRNIVASATGFDESRGDVINVDGIVFDRTSESRYEDALETPAEEGIKGLIKSLYSQYRSLINIIGIIFIISAIITFIIVRIKKRREDRLFEENLPMYASEMGDVLEEQVDQEADPAKDVEDVAMDIKSKNNEFRAQNYAKDNPEIVADLIKAWMKK
ncbi:MAG: flagellar M-ring protein FliF [Tissierellia bacterium]|nr:flagellar M-ring protein FliF [Tissierellia bacterium]